MGGLSCIKEHISARAKIERFVGILFSIAGVHRNRIQYMGRMIFGIMCRVCEAVTQRDVKMEERDGVYVRSAVEDVGEETYVDTSANR